MEKPAFFHTIKDKLGISFTELMLMLLLVSFFTVEFTNSFKPAIKIVTVSRTHIN